MRLVSGLLILLLLFVFVSCQKSKVKNALIGIWSIDTAVFKNQEIIHCLSVNVISFEEIFCKLPKTSSNCKDYQEYANEGEWEIYKDEKNTFMIRIKSENLIFSGDHKIRFKGDSVNKLLKLELLSDSLYVVCRKGLFDYDRNSNLIDDLVDLDR